MRTLKSLLASASLFALMVGCGESPAPVNPSAGPAAALQAYNPNINLQIIDWGPKEAKMGADVPNKQSDGMMGIWIKVNTTDGLGDVQVLFGGQPTEQIILAPDLLTTGAPAAWLANAGEKEVVIKQVGSQKSFSVGVFRIQP